MHRTGTARAIRSGVKTGSTHRECLKIVNRLLCGCPALLFIASLLGCGGATGSASPQPPPPSGASVTVTPSSASILLGNSQKFTAVVTNSTNAAMNWSVNDIPGGNAAVGTITSDGIYAAPRDLPVPASVSVRATSVADGSNSAAATVNIASDISVSVSPPTTPVELGATQNFTASVNSAGNPDRAVRWIVQGSGCTATACGSVDSTGDYTAPQFLTSPANITLTAISVADPSKSGTAAVTITSSFTLSVSGPASVNAGATASYAATLVPAPGSNPSRTILWSVSGQGCTGPACGTITSAGVYAAPLIPPAPANVQITATPAADPSKTVTVTVAIVAAINVTLSPTSATVPLGGTQAFHADVTGAQDTTVTWEVNGIVGGSASLGTVVNSQTDPDNTTYTAPQSLPPGGSVTIQAQSNANPGVSASATVTLSAAIQVALSPSTTTLAIGHRQTFSVHVANTPNQTVMLAVNGVPGGNAGAGQICLTGSSPCQQVSTASSGSFDYIAPAGVPSPNPVTLTATSQADGSKSAAASVTILPHIVVSILATGGQQRFTATVTGTENQQVTWTITGAACGTPAQCGSIDSTGLYTAPASAPSPDLISVVATSADDSSQSATATVTISSGPNINSLAPSSAYAGSAGGFTVAVRGLNFAPSNPGPGSTILIAGTARITSCSTNAQCSTSLAAADLAVPGNLSVRVQNPDGSTSNAVSFVVVPPGSGPDIISLTSGSPSATGKDIVVVDLSTNGGSGATGNVSLNVAAIGSFNVATGTCILGGNPVVVLRPASGTATADLCVFSVSGLDPSFTYSLTGPLPPDITIVSREPLGLGIVHLSLQVPATSAAGPRTLFVENPNKDKAAASGAIEVR
jgi:hypothetical protein